MRRTQAFRPSLLILENRWLPAVALYPDPLRNALQSSFVVRADQAKNPVVFLGDSITMNWGSAYGSAEFTADFAPLDPANFGIGGDKTADLLGRIEGGDLNGQPELAVVMIGINDLTNGSTVDQASSGVASVIQAIRTESPKTRILLLGVLPTQFPSINPEVQQLDAKISGLGNEPGVTYLNPGTLFLGADGNTTSDLYYDVLHPDAAGYQILAGAIDGTVLKLLQEGDVLAPVSSPSASEGDVSVPVSSPSPSDAEAKPSAPASTAVPTSTLASPDFDPIPLIVDSDAFSDFPTMSTLVENGSAGRARSYATVMVNVSSS